MTCLAMQNTLDGDLVGMRPLTLQELDEVAGGQPVGDILGGIGGIGAGVATVGGGLAMDAGLVIGGVVGLAGAGLVAYGLYELF